MLFHSRYSILLLHVIAIIALLDLFIEVRGLSYGDQVSMDLGQCNQRIDTAVFELPWAPELVMAWDTAATPFACVYRPLET